jgi:soluble lytic murein transglycosylase-like protein
MKMKLKFLFIFSLFLIACSIFSFHYTREPKSINEELYEKGSNETALSCERMYYLIETYSDSFCVPKYIAYGVAYKETRYRGPLDTLYNPKQTSHAGAIGAMQIMPQYASYFAGRKVTKSELMNDLETNVWLSMKILSQHYERYKNWALACGAYNTGKPILNKYAKFCGNNSEFVKNWVNLDSLTTQFFLAEL